VKGHLDVVDQNLVFAAAFDTDRVRHDVAVIGDRQSGKTTLCLAIARHFEAKQKRVVIFTHRALVSKWLPLGVDVWTIDPASYVDQPGEFRFVDADGNAGVFENRDHERPLLIVTPFEHHGSRSRYLMTALAPYVGDGLIVSSCLCCRHGAREFVGTYTHLMTASYERACGIGNVDHWIILGSDSGMAEWNRSELLHSMPAALWDLPRWTACYGNPFATQSKPHSASPFLVFRMDNEMTCGRAM
jgi:hypothetical protein